MSAVGSSRCVYVGTVDPAKLYTVEVQREGKIAVADFAESNPACSVATDPNDTDNVLLLRDRAPVATYRGEERSPVTERDVSL